MKQSIQEIPLLRTSGSEVLLPHRSELGEGPVWDEKRNCLYWVDIFQKQVHRFSVEDGCHKQFALPQMPGSLVLTISGQLLVAVADGFGLLNPETGAWRSVVAMKEALDGQRFNDGKCDPAGRFWVGSITLPGHAKTGGLYRLEGDLSAHFVAPSPGVANGMAWDLTQGLFYHIDSKAGQVLVYRYDNATGAICQPQVLLHLPQTAGVPDGMTIDTEGRLWIALFGGGKIICCNAKTGSLLQQFELPVRYPTSCTFGGPTFGDLYVTTAFTRLSAEQRLAEPLAGSVFVIKKCGFYGQAPVRFRFDDG